MKSRNLFLAATTAIMVGSVVLTPAFASAQSRDRDDHRDQDLSRSNGRSNSNGRSTQTSRQPVHLQGGYLGDGRRPYNRQDNRGNWGNQSGWSNQSGWGNRRGDGDWDDQRNRDRDDENWNRNRNRDRDRDRDGDRDYRDGRRSSGYGYGYSAPDYHSYGYAPGLGNYNQDYYRSQSYNDYRYPRYQYNDDWRTIADLAGLLAVIGILNHDDTLTFVGGAGALYSLYRYDQDRYSDDPACRLRAEYFSHPYFYRNGRRYDRVMVHRNGDDYYQFVCR
jgi:hypothetical protein